MKKVESLEGVSHVKVWPPIGIARVGNSPEFFLGPEIPGITPADATGPIAYKDDVGRMKRQAQRFRVIGFDKDDKPLGEICTDKDVLITWHVHLANKKAAWYQFAGLATQQGKVKTPHRSQALRNPKIQGELIPAKRTRLIIDSGAKDIPAKNDVIVKFDGKFSGVPGDDKDPIEVFLGEARTTKEGRLIILGGHGKSQNVVTPDYILDDFNTPGWYDDTSDGSIDVTVTIGEKKLTTLGNPDLRGWVLIATPKYAPTIVQPTTLYDTMYNVAVQHDNDNPDAKKWATGAFAPVKEVNYYRDILPILNRAVQLSWVNQDAHSGHGPGAPGYFLTDEWQAKLSSPSPAYEADRKNVFFRLRSPSKAEDPDFNSDERVGQAYPFFMPRLSGSGGRTTIGDPSTWTALTQEQYRLLKLWSEGNFQNDNKEFYSPFQTEGDFFTKMKGNLEEELKYRAQAPLHYGIGAPLYPGIEMSYTAFLASTFSSLLRFAEATTPGDITKYLSCPWQSDFYLCREHWWPATRPDNIVPQSEYDKAFGVGKTGYELATSLSKRVPWERGLGKTYDLWGALPLFGNQDMVRQWSQLGVIVPKDKQFNICVETERNFIPRIPDTVPSIDTIEELRAALSSAMKVELTTIPLYLYSQFSINAGPANEYTPGGPTDEPISAASKGIGKEAAGIIKSVVTEEMLHLCLAANVLKAIGGKPVLYAKDFIPTYPSNLPYHTPYINLELSKPTADHVKTFLAVEEPKDPFGVPQSSDYATIGQFYMSVEDALKNLDTASIKNTGKSIFDPESAKYQFAPGLGYAPKIHDSGSVVTVKNLNTAIDALKLIVEQGEGIAHGLHISKYDDPAHKELSHYASFKKLESIASDPNLLFWPVPVSPKLNDYKTNDIISIAILFNASYCYLLKCIEHLYTCGDEAERRRIVFKGMFGAMLGLIPPIANILVRMKIDKTTNAAPTFEFYQFSSANGAVAQLKALLNQAVAAQPGGGLKTALLFLQPVIEGLYDLKFE